MKCKKHPIDPSSNGGVCASCLRERLVAIIAAQVQAQREALFQHGQQGCRKSDAQLPSFVSVSPYVSHRKSDSAATWQVQGQHRRFYRTPQVGPIAVAAAVEKDKKGNKGRFSSVLHGLFRSKSVQTGLDTGPVSDRGVSVDSCAASPSWLSMIVPGRRKKQVQTFSVEEYSSKAGRGMSPSKVEDNENCRDGSSGYSSESSQGWKQTPRRTPATRRCKGRTATHSRNASGLAFCLSPLVRPSPNRKLTQKVGPPEGEVRGAAKPQLSTAPSFCKNRSRKLADFGKQSYNPPYPIH